MADDPELSWIDGVQIICVQRRITRKISHNESVLWHPSCSLEDADPSERPVCSRSETPNLCRASSDFACCFSDGNSRIAPYYGVAGDVRRCNGCPVYVPVSVRFRWGDRKGHGIGCAITEFLRNRVFRSSLRKAGSCCKHRCSVGCLLRTLSG